MTATSPPSEAELREWRALRSLPQPGPETLRTVYRCAFPALFDEYDRLSAAVRVQPVASLIWTSNGEAGDGQSACSGCGEERDAPHSWQECAVALKRERDQLIDHAIEIDRLLQLAAQEADEMAGQMELLRAAVRLGGMP